MEALRSSSFFNDCSDDDLKRLAEICHFEEFPARATVFEEYEPARIVYVIVSGEISLAICEPKVSCRQIATVHAGDLMGWSVLVGRARLYDTAFTQTPVTALAFDGDELMKFCVTNPSFGFQFMRRVACTLAERLGGTRLQLLDMCGVQLPKVPIETD
jgi:CRP-like cAMP-binding protein